MSFTTPRRKYPEESNLENEKARKLFPLFPTDDQEPPCSERH
jgi:hypothetical protein